MKKPTLQYKGKKVSLNVSYQNIFLTFYKKVTCSLLAIMYNITQPNCLGQWILNATHDIYPILMSQKNAK